MGDLIGREGLQLAALPRQALQGFFIGIQNPAQGALTLQKIIHRGCGGQDLHPAQPMQFVEGGDPAGGKMGRVALFTLQICNRLPVDRDATHEFLQFPAHAVQLPAADVQAAIDFLQLGDLGPLRHGDLSHFGFAGGKLPIDLFGLSLKTVRFCGRRSGNDPNIRLTIAEVAA